MSLSVVQVAELYAVAKDCKRFGDPVSQHTLTDIEKALLELLALKRQAPSTRKDEECPGVGSATSTYRQVEGNALDH